jgi:hypothetical protein
MKAGSMRRAGKRCHSDANSETAPPHSLSDLRMRAGGVGLDPRCRCIGMCKLFPDDSTNGRWRKLALDNL